MTRPASGEATRGPDDLTLIRGIGPKYVIALRAMGISPKTAYEVEKRPFFATKDGTGTPVMDVFA